MTDKSQKKTERFTESPIKGYAAEMPCAGKYYNNSNCNKKSRCKYKTNDNLCGLDITGD